MVSVRAVAAMPSLRLSVCTGTDLLDREVSRIYGTELPDPARFLSGGELVLTGLLWLRADADVPPFVAALADRGVAGLVACDADTGVIPPSLVDECRRRGVPLLAAAVDLSFADIIDQVGRALAAERGTRRPPRRLMTALARGAELPELLTMAAAELDAPCWVLTPLGRVVAGSGHPLSADRVEILIREFLRADGRARWVRGQDDSATVLPLPDSGGTELTRWFLTVGRAEPKDEVVAELADVIAIQRNRIQEARRRTDQVTGALLRAILTGTAGPAEIAATATAAGLDVRRPLRVLAVTTPGAPPGRAATVLAELVATIETAGRPGLLGTADDQVYALLPAGQETDTELADRVTAALRHLEAVLTTSRIVIGISAVTSGPELRGAVQEARHTRELGERQPGRTRVVAGTEVAVHQLLLATVPDELRRALRRRVLGRLFDYDAEHDGSLVRTLTVFLECSGSWSRAAARLHVHVNTLRYRIGRIEELTGADLADFTQRVDVYLALHAES